MNNSHLKNSTLSMQKAKKVKKLPMKVKDFRSNCEQNIRKL